MKEKNKPKSEIIAEIESLDSKEFFQTLFEYAPDAYYINDLEGHLLYGNKAAERITGYQREELVGKNFFELNLLDKEDIPKAKKAIKQNKKGLSVGPEEYILNCKDKTKIPVEISTYPLKIKNKDLVLAIARDITKRKKIQEKYKTITEGSADAIFITDQEGNYRYTNSAASRLLGYPENELTRMNIRDVTRPEDMEETLRSFQEIKKKGKLFQEYYLVSKDGSLVPVDLNATVLPNGFIYGSCRDISRRKQYEQHITHLNEVLRAIRRVNALIVREKDRSKLIHKTCDIMVDMKGFTHAWIVLWDRQGNYLDSAQCGIDKPFDQLKEQFKKRNLPSCVRKAFKNKPNIITTMSSDQCSECLLYPFNKDKVENTVCLVYQEIIYGVLSLGSFKVYSQDRKIQELLKEVASDIAFALNNIQIDNALHERLKEMRCFYDISSLMIKLDISVDEFLQSAVEYLPPAWQYPELACARITLETKEYKTTNFRKTKLCQSVPLLINNRTAGYIEVCYRKPVTSPEDDLFSKEEYDLLKNMARNISQYLQRRQTDENIRQSQVLLRHIIDTTASCIFVKDYDGRYLMANQFMAELHHTTPDEMLGKTDLDFTQQEITTPEEAEQFLKDDREVINQKKAKLFPEEPFTMPDGSIRWFYTHKVPISLDNNPHCILGVATDITELKQSRQDLQKAINSTIEIISKLSETRDPYTSGHQERVSQIATRIAQEFDLSQKEIEEIRIASLIHDIGKIGVPSEILTKPGKLSGIEFDLIKEHPRTGYEILKDIYFPYPLAQIIRQHHERINGSGYPNGLKGDEILLEAKIIGVADVVEAMFSHRPYRPALGIDVALDEITKNKGVLYDPEVVDACVKLFREKGFEFE